MFPCIEEEDDIAILWDLPCYSRHSQMRKLWQQQSHRGTLKETRLGIFSFGKFDKENDYAHKKSKTGG